MARLNVSHTNNGMKATGTTRMVLLQYTAPASGGAVVRRGRVTFDGTAPTGTKILTEFIKGMTGGSGGTNRAPVKVSGHTGSVQGTGLETIPNATLPTGGTTVHQESAHPQHGCEMPREVVLNPGETFSVLTNGGSVNAMCSLDIEE